MKLPEICPPNQTAAKRGALPSSPFLPTLLRVSEPHQLCCLPSACVRHLILAGKKNQNNEPFFLNLFSDSFRWYTVATRINFIDKYLCTEMKDAYMKAKFTDKLHVL